MQPYVQIERVSITNFRSILSAEVRLSPMTIFVGPNGSGKTSFIDALLFVRDSLRHSPQQAAKDRHGIFGLLHAPVRLPCVSKFVFELKSEKGFSAFYSVDLETQTAGSMVIAREECRVSDTKGNRHSYVVENGAVKGTATVFPAVSPDRLYLVNASGLPEFRLIYDFFTGIAAAEPRSSGAYLFADNLSLKSDTRFTARFQELIRQHPSRAEIIRDYLRAIAPPFDRFEITEINDQTTLKFVEKSEGHDSNHFYMSQVSAGLLHAAEMLLLLFEPAHEGSPESPLVLEEPESLLHPGAIQVLRDALLEANELRQILITSHSPELIDDPSVPAEWIRSVYRTYSGTHIEPLDTATQSIVRDRLFTAGELLRQGGLTSRTHAYSTQDDLAK